MICPRIPVFVRKEYELNRKWITDDNDENIAVTSFVVSHKFVKDNYKNCPNKYDSLEEFLEAYVPEEDGQYLFKLAVNTKNLIEDLGMQPID